MKERGGKSRAKERERQKEREREKGLHSVSKAVTLSKQLDSLWIPTKRHV